MIPYVHRRTLEVARAAAVLEAVVFTDRLTRVGRPTLVPAEVVTDARKFVRMGVFRSLARCLAILVCYELRLPIPARAFFSPIR